MAFKRSFEHIEGNWPCYIYLKVPFTKKFCKLLEIIVLDSFNKNKIIESRFISEKSFHISLSRSFVLRHHQIQPFLNRLHSILPSQLYLLSYYPIILSLSYYLFLYLIDYNYILNYFVSILFYIMTIKLENFYVFQLKIVIL